MTGLTNKAHPSRGYLIKRENSERGRTVSREVATCLAADSVTTTRRLKIEETIQHYPF